MKKISLRDVLRQVKYDLIGKDSYRGVTLTYSWLANQFGHFGLGFIPTYVLFVILFNYYVLNAGMIAALCIWGAWILFETYNVVKPLLFSHEKKSAFPTPWGNVIYDTLTDLTFFGLGAFAAGALSAYTHALLICLLTLTVIAIYPSWYWYRTKMYQQEASYPFQFRLSQWSVTPGDDNKSKILEFMKTDTNGKHLFVFGGFNTGKTSLCVALANERSIAHDTCKYATAMKLFSLFFEQPATDGEVNSLWNWREASLLVIDDINPGFAMQKDILCANDFLLFMDQDHMGDKNKKAIRDKNVIWVLGTDESIDTTQSEWENMLVNDLGVAKEKIFTINLSATLPIPMTNDAMSS